MLQGKATEIQKKYGTTAFMYTEYPHKRFWEKGVEPELGGDTPSMLYIHIPYCTQLCYFCTCHIEITNNYDKVKTYLEVLYKEIDLLAKFKFNIKEVHLGGGSPTILNKDEFDELIKNLRKLVNIDFLDEFSIEIDPRRVSQEEMVHYANNGINRVSFGVQDFDEEVQEKVNRFQPAKLIEDLITPQIREHFSHGVNFDIICGLPRQTVTTMGDTCLEILRLKPDRICLNYLHYSPEMAKHQILMGELPDFTLRKELFTTALKILVTGGYVRTGYDHFALPADGNAKALKEGKVGWNSLGTNPGNVKDTIGVGVSSIGSIGNTYYQNFYEVADYREAIEAGKLPIFRGHTLTEDELLRRDIIQTLRSYFHVDLNGFKHYFTKELKMLEEFEADGLVKVDDTKIKVLEPEYTNLVCRVFDKFYEGEGKAPDLGERIHE